MPGGLRGWRAVLALTAVTALAGGCAIGPAAHRAEREGAGQPTGAATSEPDGAGGAGGTGEAGGSGGASASPGESPGPATEPPPEPAPAQGSAQIAATLAEGLGPACCLAPMPGGDLLAGAADGSLVRVGQDGTVTPVGALEDDSRLLGLAFASGSALDWVYVLHATDSAARVDRYVYYGSHPAGEQLGESRSTVLGDIPTGPEHGGGALAFGPDGNLYVATGDTGAPALAADPDSLAGKILRITPEGDEAPGNPFPGSPVYSLGHAEPAGLAWDEQGMLWAADAGRAGGVELNSIAPGGTYGEGADAQQGTAPVHTWQDPQVVAGGLAFAQGCLWMPDPPGGRLWRIPLDGTRLVADPQPLLAAELSGPVAVAAGAGNAGDAGELTLLDGQDASLLRLAVS
ncbi:PQQ-dependent sugar dehydrogenase [Streptomyces hoynatensis]|uniref:PQQ-dependent sugar dehydrogenase n=1 Tax=Streptomyces hoynatensis TaxID=1141874 RepID=A0A3A9Z0N9_9ACTN|nr:PQQ-dependent sugar dehydrogenase [Streptomyces hoynatensis]RKN41843.1 PQQ-dependent sugar dehydrogenase [Streptomyces hoynatensis]